MEGTSLIRRFLVVSNRVSFASSKYEEEQPNTTVVDLFLPLSTYWKIVDLIQKADYLLASQEQVSDIQDIYKNLFMVAAPYAMTENDRNWLFKRGAKTKQR